MNYEHEPGRPRRTGHRLGVFQVPFLRQDVDTAFDELIHRCWGRTEWQPAVDVQETVDAYHVQFDLPGVDVADLHVVARDRMLVLEGIKKPSGPAAGSRLLHSERPRGRFCRTVEFAESIDIDAVENRYEQGVLSLRLPKRKQREELTHGRIHIRIQTDE